ncbi:MAG: hypothetical protein O7H39_03595, partial [Gammaproteobacteria bacterium]|nr:hypothetical protein [Gammaproteobacteria bacterium]
MNNRLDHAELHRLDTEGYVVRERVFTASEVQNLADACEKMVERVVRAVNHEKHSPKTTAGNYLFQTNRDLCTVVKWEPEYPDEVQGVEPFAHFDAALNAWGNDRRLTAPMLDLLGVDAVGLFTEKLNLKRRLVGG